MWTIEKNLYLGEDTDAHDIVGLEANKIKCIINCTKTCVDFSSDLPDDVQKYRIAVNDNDRSYDIILFDALPQAIVCIQKHLSAGHGVLVHCLSARQRSATVLAAYLIWKHNYCIEKAVNFIKEKRSAAFTPKINFIRVLEWWKADRQEMSDDYADSKQSSTEQFITLPPKDGNII